MLIVLLKIIENTKIFLTCRDFYILVIPIFSYVCFCTVSLDIEYFFRVAYVKIAF